MARWCVLSLIRNGCAAVGCSPASTPGQPLLRSPRRGAGTDRGRLPRPRRLPAHRGDRLPAGADATGQPAPDWADMRDYDIVVVTGGRAARPASTGC
ncbi:hypothetical protein NKH77_02665 [Streptomyces sp. M19]